MTRREEEKKRSLADLARIARSVGGGAPATPPPSKPPARPVAPPKKAPAPTPPPKTAEDPGSARRRRVQMEARQAKLEEDRRLRARREAELQRGANLGWRGMDTMGVPSSIRRTAFDRKEATVSQKIQDVLGDPREKEGRQKARAKGKRQNG